MSVCGWGAGDKGGSCVPPPQATQSTDESLHFPKCLAADWKQSKVAPLLGRKKPHSQKAKERVPQGHLLSQSPVCSPHSQLNHDAACSRIQAGSWLSPFCFKAAGKTFPLGPSQPTAAGGWGSVSHGLPRVKENKNQPQIQEGKKAGMQNIELNPKYEASV